MLLGCIDSTLQRRNPGHGINSLKRIFKLRLIKELKKRF